MLEPMERKAGADRPLAALAAPIFAENLVRTSLTAVDQFMLYGFATAAAAAMSAAGQFAFFLQLLYQMPSIGAGIHWITGSNRLESRRAFAEKRAPEWKGWNDPEDRFRTPKLDDGKNG